MADLRPQIAIKITDPTNNAQSAGVDAGRRVRRPGKFSPTEDLPRSHCRQECDSGNSDTTGDSSRGVPPLHAAGGGPLGPHGGRAAGRDPVDRGAANLRSGGKGHVGIPPAQPERPADNGLGYE